jgi:hypothetical protein
MSHHGICKKRHCSTSHKQNKSDQHARCMLPNVTSHNWRTRATAKTAASDQC